MQPCYRPVAEMTLDETVECIREKGSKALSVITHNPESASITDWALGFLAALILLNLLLLFLGLLTPRRDI
jgi:hypothetical protein